MKARVDPHAADAACHLAEPSVPDCDWRGCAGERGGIDRAMRVRELAIFSCALHQLALEERSATMAPLSVLQGELLKVTALRF